MSYKHETFSYKQYFHNDKISFKGLVFGWLCYLLLFPEECVLAVEAVLYHLKRFRIQHYYYCYSSSMPKMSFKWP